MSNDLLEDINLITAVWPGNGDRLAAVICVSASYDTKYWVIVGLCILKSLQNYRSNSVGSAIPTRSVIEGIAISCQRLSVLTLFCLKQRYDVERYIDQ